MACGFLLAVYLVKEAPKWLPKWFPTAGQKSESDARTVPIKPHTITPMLIPDPVVPIFPLSPAPKKPTKIFNNVSPKLPEDTASDSEVDQANAKHERAVFAWTDKGEVVTFHFDYSQPSKYEEESDTETDSSVLSVYGDQDQVLQQPVSSLSHM